VSLGFAFLLLLFTGCALGFLFVINLIDAAETASSAAEASMVWTRLDRKKFFKRLRSVADWRLLGFAAALFTAVVVMSGVLFLIIPRFELATGFFLDRYITRKSHTGFTENIKFGDVTELIRDGSVAMRVDLTETSGLIERPYWRMVVLDEYTQQGFGMSAGMKAELLSGQSLRRGVEGRRSNRGIKPVGGVWTFYIEPGVSRFLPLPGSFGTLRLRDQVPLQIGAAQRIVAFRTEPMAMAAFQLEMVEQSSQLPDMSFPDLLKQSRASTGKSSGRKKSNPMANLVGPEGDQNHAVLKRMVDEIDRGAPAMPAEEFARRATAWLQAHHSYSSSVSVPVGEGRDEIVRWLESSEPGFCEYFASGFTVLARTAGYPARVITGFHGGMLNAFENYYMVRNSDAHAWAEIYDGKTAWLRVDPTPGAAATAESLAAQLAGQEHDSSLSARFDSLRVLWYRRIVNFDSRAQVQMLEQVKTFTLDSSSVIRTKFEEISKQLKAWIGQPWDVIRLSKTGGLLVGLIAFLWFLGQLSRALWLRWRRWRRPQEFDPVRREAGQQLTRLRTLTEASMIEGGGAITVVVGELRQLRYGRRETGPEPGTVFKRAKQIKKSIRR